jgi:GNAT superfamily N-acetyltransferase
VVCPFTSSPALLQALQAREFVPVGFSTTLYAVPADPHTSPPEHAHRSTVSADVTVEQLGTDDLSALVEIIADTNGWNAPDVRPGLRAYYKLVTAAQYQGEDRDNWHCYIARVDGRPAASAALYLHDGIGSLTADGTHPDHRGHGCQLALIRRRIADAARAGCELVVTQTAPGSISQRNMERAGCRTAYTRTVWEQR